MKISIASLNMNQRRLRVFHFMNSGTKSCEQFLFQKAKLYNYAEPNSRASALKT